MGLLAVQEDAADASLGLGLGDGPQAVLVDQPVFQVTVLFLADAAVERVYYVGDGVYAGQIDAAQVAQAVVLVVRGSGLSGFCFRSPAGV